MSELWIGFVADPGLNEILAVCVSLMLDAVLLALGVELRRSAELDSFSICFLML